jgi:hypothetical protein
LFDIDSHGYPPGGNRGNGGRLGNTGTLRNIKFHED